jgi:molybdenum ABC transporter molybdate-binding protein
MATVAFGLAGGGAIAGAAGGPCGTTGVASGSNPLTCTYATVGSDTFTVPAGVTSATFTVVGAIGGNYFTDGDASHPDPAGALVGRGGGGGGGASGTLSVTPGQVLQVDVAGAGATGTAASRSGGMMNGPSGGSGGLGGFGGSNDGVAGGPGDATGANGGTAFNGGNGAGGGGSSDVRLDGAGCAALTCGLADRVLVGAGGGGAGGTGGQGNAIGGAGGNGGDANGAPGGSSVDGGNFGVSGAGATQSAGGAGGLEPGLNTVGANPTDPRYGGNGADGASGSGGAGGHGNLPCTGTQTPPCSSSSSNSGGGAGGGAGGGYFGGGGGSGGGGLFGGGGGAGGGGGGASSYVTANATGPALTANANQNTSAVHVNADTTETYIINGSINSGNGQVTITWTPPPPAPAPTPTPTTPAPPGPVPAPPATVPLHVLVASPLAGAFRSIDRHETYSAGDSDTLARALASGAAGDVFAGVDDAAFASLVRSGRIGTPVAVASTRLVLVVPKRKGDSVKKLADLKHAGIRFLLARSGVALGAQARSVLARLHLSAAVKHATVTADTAGEMATRVAAGKADAALVYASDATKASKGKLRVLTVPAAGRPAVKFEIAVVKRTGQPAAVAAYIAKILSPAGQAALRSAGLGKG